MYDPKGEEALGSDSSMPNAVKLLVEKLSGTSIQVTVPPVQTGGILPLKGPKEVFIRIWDSSTKQYGPPSPKINLEFNTNVYLCRQNECSPKKIAKNGTQVLVQHGANQCTSQVFHMTDFAEQTTPEKLPKIGGGWNNWDMKGIDVLVENLKMPQLWKLVEFGFSYGHICYDKQTDSYKSCVHNPKVKLEQDLSKIEGQTLLPRASVYWEAKSGWFENVGVAYIYNIYVRGPEGWANIPF